MCKLLSLNNALGEPPRSRGGLLSPSNFKPPMPRHQTYIETRGSSCAWIFKKPRSPVEVLNDSDGQAINLSRAMIGSETRTRVLDAYACLVNPGKVISLGNADDRIARAVQFANEISRRTPAASPKRVRRRLPLEMDSDIRRIDEALERLRDVQLEDTSTADVVRRYDWARAFFLCDERGTNWETDLGAELARRLALVQGKVTLIISARPAWLESEQRWNQTKIEMNNIETEEVWVNF